MRRRFQKRRAPADVYVRIRAAVPLETAVEVFTGETPDRHGLIHCPFGIHTDADKSLKVYPDGTFCCFGCHKGGDVINFTREFFHVSPLEAAKILDDKFNLGITDGHSDPAAVAAALNTAKKQREEADRREALLWQAAMNVREKRQRLDALGKPRTIEDGGTYARALADLERSEELYQQLTNELRQKKQTFRPST